MLGLKILDVLSMLPLTMTSRLPLSLATRQKNLGVPGLPIFAGFLALAVAVHVLRGRR